MSPLSTSAAAWPSSLPTQPMHIPKRPSGRATAATERGRRPGFTTHRLPSDIYQHRSDKLDPAVAALLAVTSIPKPCAKGRRSQTNDIREERKRRDELIASLCDSDDAYDNGSVTTSVSRAGASTSPRRDVLTAAIERLSVKDQEGPDEEEDAAEEEGEPSVLSYDSVPSLSHSNSTDVDDDDVASITSLSDPHTTLPESRKCTARTRARSSLTQRRGRALAISSPPGEDCAFSHPLSIDLDPSPSRSTTPAPLSTAKRPIRPHRPETSPPDAKVTLNLRSNLTSSLSYLRSSFRRWPSISTFPVPFVRADDFLTRSIPFTDERRPRLDVPVDGGVAAAETRRYLNPTSQPSATRPLVTHGLFSQLDDKACKASIQLQSYPFSRRMSSSSSSAATRHKSKSASDATRNTCTPSSLPPGNAGAAGSVTGGGVPRQREARENPDFLRVIVLEMNMRKSGKLNKTGAGRARFALPPRVSPPDRHEVEAKDVAEKLPSRWMEWEMT